MTSFVALRHRPFHRYFLSRELSARRQDVTNQDTITAGLLLPDLQGRLCRLSDHRASGGGEPARGAAHRPLAPGGGGGARHCAAAGGGLRPRARPRHGGARDSPLVSRTAAPYSFAVYQHVERGVWVAALRRAVICMEHAGLRQQCHTSCAPAAPAGALQQWPVTDRFWEGPDPAWQWW